MDQGLTFDSYIKNIAKTAFFHLWNIAKIRYFLFFKDIEKIIHAFVTSRVDSFTSILSGCPNSSLRILQLIQNSVARLLSRTKRRQHITPVLESLHWRPVRYRDSFQLLLITYRALHAQVPSYITDLFEQHHPLRALRSGPFCVSVFSPLVRAHDRPLEPGSTQGFFPLGSFYSATAALCFFVRCS